MAAPSELSLEAIRLFMLENGGKVTNHDLVKHFKRFLTNPDTRVEARNQFKEYVNTLATIRNDEGEKNLVLKKKFRQMEPATSTPPTSPGPSLDSVSLSSMPSTSSILFASSESLNVTSPSRQPPPYRAPPPPTSPPPTPPPPFPTEALSSPRQDSADNSLPDTPPVPPRRKSSDKLRLDNKENVDTTKRPKTAVGAETGTLVAPLEGELEPEEQISVKERTQKFNRLASEGELQRVQVLQARRKLDKNGADDDGDGDTSSVTSLDGRAREWLVRAAQGDHLALTKLAADNPRLARLRDPTSGYTALHWGAKHGNEHVVKLIAGTHGADVNARTHGGYTPAHIAMQFGHEHIFNLLVQVYYADPNLRDWSGRKPRQYQTSQDTAVSADTFRKIKARKKHSEKDLGFLRIGSLNVRVKRTTEAFSNFLGVGTNSDKLHKTWGSADNIQQVDRHIMPPPKVNPIKKRCSRRAQDFSGSYSTPSTPPSHSRTGLMPGPGQDSDSDNACGFGTNWQGTA